MSDPLAQICADDALRERGVGVRFEIERNATRIPCFAVRFNGVAVAYINRCTHLPMELDWNAGKFFDFDDAHLICSTHGALYDPATGVGRGGPCRGVGLEPVAIVERDRAIWLRHDRLAAPKLAPLPASTP